MLYSTDKEEEKRIQEYYNNPKKRLEHGKNARSYALEYYDWNTILKSKWLDFIKKVQK